MKKLFILGNGNDWCEISLQGLLKHSNIYLTNRKVPVNGKLKNRIAKIYFSYRLNKRIKMPFKSLWYSDIMKYIKKNSNYNDSISVLIYDHNVFGGEPSFINHLRKNIENVKIYYIFTNIVKYTSASEKKYVDKLNIWYDKVFAFDKLDAIKYNFEYSPLIYDAKPNNTKETINEDSVFYVGQAKDRLEMLLKSYEKLKKIGIKCDFHIANVDENKKKYEEEIIYNQFMTYKDAITSIKNATCLIDIIQGDSTGLTIKTCEAICYDKKLITTNKHVKEYPFYNPKYIKIIESEEDIDINFFNENKEVHYTKQDKEYFSGESFLKRIWKN